MLTSPITVTTIAAANRRRLQPPADLGRPSRAPTRRSDARRRQTRGDSQRQVPLVAISPATYTRRVTIAASVPHRVVDDHATRLKSMTFGSRSSISTTTGLDGAPGARARVRGAAGRCARPDRVRVVHPCCRPGLGRARRAVDPRHLPRDARRGTPLSRYRRRARMPPFRTHRRWPCARL